MKTKNLIFFEQILDSSLKTGPPVTKKYCEIKVEIDGKPVKLQPVGDFLKGICKA